MNDRHVEALRYKLVPREGIDYNEELPAVERELEGFSIRLEAGELTVTMRDHYDSVSAAEAAVQPYLDAWQANAALSANRPEFDFEVARAEVVDRDPDAKSGGVTIKSGVARAGAHAGNAKSLTFRGAYPEPPDGFTLDPDAEALWNRWQAYVEGREPLQTMAYFCLTVLQLHGGRSGAQTRFAVSRTVLDTLGKLSTETGDLSTARKATLKRRPITEAEHAWLEGAVKALVRRAGEVAAAPRAAHPAIAMSDLPGL